MRQLSDAELAEYIQLQQDIKLATERLEALKEVLKARGTFSTKKFCCLVTEQCQDRLAGLSEVAQVFGRETLERYALIRQHTFQVVKVSQIVKAKRKDTALTK